MGRKEMVVLVVGVALASFLIRLLIGHPLFGVSVNKISSKLF